MKSSRTDADMTADTVLSNPNGKTLAVISANQIERDGVIGVLANTHPELTTIAFVTVRECVGFSTNPDVIMLRVSQDTSAQMALQDIEQLRSAFPGVPVMAITRD